MCTSLGFHVKLWYLAWEIETYQAKAAQVEHAVLHMTGSVSGKYHFIKHTKQVFV